MTVRNLDSLFRPNSVAVIGASNTPGSVGTVVFRNMLGAGFGGIVTLVNPRHAAVQGVRAYPTVSEALVETLGFTKHPDTKASILEVRLQLSA